VTVAAKRRPGAAWVPQPGPQTRLVTSPIEDIFYGGARGGGKSDGLLGDAAIRANDYGKAFRGILFRRTYPELEELVSRSKEIFTPLGAVWGADPRMWTFPRGGTLKMRYLDIDADAEHYLGHQYSWEGFDQLEQWPSVAPIDRLWGSLRSAVGAPCVRRSSGNPGGAGHHWVKARYIDAARANHPFTYCPLEKERPDLKITACFIPALLEDNLILQQNDPEYEKRLAASGGTQLFKAWRYGLWDIFLGAVFEEWRPQFHVLSEQFRVPRGWRWAAGLDWGYRAPGWFGLFAQGPEGDIVLWRELYFSKETAYNVGYTIGQNTMSYPLEYIAADEQMWQKQGTGSPTLAEEMQHGLVDAYGKIEDTPQMQPATHGRGSRLVKAQIMHRYLRWEVHPKTGELLPWGRPLLRVHPSCRHFIRTLPALPYVPEGAHGAAAEDIDSSAEDHPYDGACAYLMSRPSLPERAPEAFDENAHPGMTKKGKRKERIPRWEQVQRAQQNQQQFTGATPHYRRPRPSDLEEVGDDYL